MSYTICSRFKGEHIVYAGYTICTWREHIVYGAFCGSTKLLTVHYLEFLSLKGGCTGSSESTHVKLPNYWKSHALVQI